MLIVLNLPLIGMWVKVLKTPESILFPIILILTMVGVYTVRNNVFDIYLMIFFGILGYLFKKLDFEIAPLILAFVLGSMFEGAMRQSLIMSRGNLLVFFSRPLSAIFLGIATLLFLISSVPFLRKKRLKLGYGD
jgi:putative tricarboxylic transport membrane protein